MRNVVGDPESTARPNRRGEPNCIVGDGSPLESLEENMNDDIETIRKELPYYDGPLGDGWAALDRLEAELTRASDHFNEAVQERDVEVERLRYTMHEATVTLAGLAEREYAARLAHDRLRNALAEEKE